jgi:hypothetical protein
MVKQIAKQPPPQDSDCGGRGKRLPRAEALHGMLYRYTVGATSSVVAMQAASVGRVRQMLHGRKAARSTVHDAGRCRGE